MSVKLISNIAKSKTAANRIVSTVDSSVIEQAIKNLQAALRANQKRQADAAAKARNASLKKIKQLMDKMGLSAADIKTLGKSPKRRKASSSKGFAKSKRGPKKGSKVAAKYQLKVGKQTHKWTGRGRMPVVFKEFVDKGGVLDKCLIK